MLAAAASADTITFTGSTIALRGCTIQAVQNGQVSYLDANGQRQRRPLEQIAAVGFDGLPELDQAEAALAQGDLDVGLRALLKARLRASTELQRLWVHVRLANVHDARAEPVQAVGHAAAVFMLSEDATWRRLRPVSLASAKATTPATYPAAREALANLQAAAKKVRTPELRREIDAMLQVVQPIHDELSKSWSGAAVEPESTISGFTHAQIETEIALAAAPAEGVTAPAAPREAPVAAAPPQPSPAAGASAPPQPPSPRPSDPRSAAAIDELLSAQKFTDALALCQQIEENPGERDLARFLYQYGRALSGAGRKRDAAVMLTRCAVLYSDSNDAGPALIETALIYRDEFRKPEVARRLLEKVIADAQAADQASTALLAREVLDTLR